jgi:predicted RNase H-like nuclease (RuvC/YqgF family)
MITGNEGYIIDVIADLQKRLASATASNDYLRKVNKDLEDHSKKLFAENLKLEDELKRCLANIDGKNDLILACDKLVLEQKETIETLQSSVKSMDLEYQKLAAEYNALS